MQQKGTGHWHFHLLFILIIVTLWIKSTSFAFKLIAAGISVFISFVIHDSFYTKKKNRNTSCPSWIEASKKEKSEFNLIKFPSKDTACIQIFESALLSCSIYLMKYDNKSPFRSGVSSRSADSAFFVDFGASQMRFAPYIVGIYFVWRHITVPVLQHNLQWDGRLGLIC